MSYMANLVHQPMQIRQENRILGGKLLSADASQKTRLILLNTRCIALNVASLVCGSMGNLFLLFNFTRRVRYIVALPTTITLFYFATGILIGITSSMNLYVPPGPDEVYSQGFWHAIIAACLYLFCSMILMVNMLGYFLGHYPQHFTLTDEQRNLILQTMMFFLWLAGGAAVFARTSGDWQFVDALYFCDVTILTVGFGDYSAPNDVSRGLVFPYSVGGIVMLGLMVSSIHKFAGELSKDNVIRKHIETKRQRTLSFAVSSSTEITQSNDIEKRPKWSPGHPPSISRPLPSTDRNERPPQKVAFDNEDEDPAQPSSGFSNGTPYRSPIHRTFRAMGQPVKTLKRARSKKSKVILMRQEKDRFDAMRAIQKGASNFKKWYALLLSVVAFALLWCVGAVVFWITEQSTQQLTYFQSLYFCYVSLLTIGYGDLSPKSNAGKPFFIVWSLIAVPTMTILISDMGDTVIASFKRGTFKLADWTILPKTGIYRAFVENNPWLGGLIQRKVEKKRIQRGFSFGFNENELPSASLEELAGLENLDDAELTHRLALAIRKTADDLKHSYPRRYTYEEWVEFTRLIRFTSRTSEELQQDEEDDGVIEWDWIGDNSPMLSELNEAEWVLDRLCESLMRLLKKDNLVRITAAVTSAESQKNSRVDSLVPSTPAVRRSTSRMRSIDEIRPQNKGEPAGG
jgi:potassium channel subfamily K, other eukaryote